MSFVDSNVRPELATASQGFGPASHNPRSSTPPWNFSYPGRYKPAEPKLSDSDLEYYGHMWNASWTIIPNLAERQLQFTFAPGRL